MGNTRRHVLGLDEMRGRNLCLNQIIYCTVSEVIINHTRAWVLQRSYADVMRTINLILIQMCLESLCDKILIRSLRVLQVEEL